MPPPTQLAGTDGQPSGLEVCGNNGLVHRETRLEEVCSSELPRPEQFTTMGGFYFCSRDADCTDQPHGYCMLTCPVGAFCMYGCVTDADCGPDAECVCGSPVGRCQPSDCRDESECGEGFLCAKWGEGFRCQRPEDECAVDSDCPSSERDGLKFEGMCTESEGALKCVLDLPVACGRPFLVCGAPRWADRAPTSFTFTRAGAYGADTELLGKPRLDVVKLDMATRTAIGHYWTQVGLMEHASIAAFARFVLQLMHLGAPLPLLEAAQSALSDETEHAKECFAIATRFLAQPVGPGALRMNGALSETNVAEIVRLTIAEGCIGETLAAMEAAEAAATCVDPHILGVLRRVQADELRHAELAWRFVQWALSQAESGAARAALEAVIRDEFAAQGASPSDSRAHASAAPERVSTPPSNCAERPRSVLATRAELTLAGYGVVSTATRRELRDLALRDVIAPCAAELLRAGVAPEHSGAPSVDGSFLA